MKHLLALLLTLNVAFAFADELSAESKKKVVAFIDCVKNNNIEELSLNTAYPLQRMYPVKAISTNNEFVSRYKEVFDDSLVVLIVDSDLENDWAEMGWRGIMFLNGQIWLDTDGRLIGVNYQSAFEKSLCAQLVAVEKLTLHESIRDFEEPLYVLETIKYKLRIDRLGQGSYRLALWPINSNMNDEPEVIITPGNLVYDGNGGNHRFDFFNGDLVYSCAINILGNEDTPPAELIIYKPAEIQQAKIIR